MTRTVFADFNALTESESVRLTTTRSAEDVRRYGIRHGDWIWLTDGELQVGARVAEDPRYGPIAVPAWDTMVRLDEDPPTGLPALRDELNSVFEPGSASPPDERRVLQLLTWWERRAPDAERGAHLLAARRACALLALGHDHLALMAAEEAREIDPTNPDILYLYLDLLSRTAPARAAAEAERIMATDDVAAPVVAACVNALSAHAEGLSGEEFPAACRRVLGWSDRFESAPAREGIAGAILALVRFNQGLAHLGLGETPAARERFRQARAADPDNPDARVIDEVLQQKGYGQQVREIAARYRQRPTAA